MTYQETPLNIMSLMLLGVYDTNAPETGIVGQFHDNGARAIKVESDGATNIAYAARHGMLAVGRSIAALENPMNGIAPSAAAADHWVDKVFLPWATKYPEDRMKKVYWEDAYNELGSLEDPATLAGFGAFEERRQQRMHDLGYRCCVFNFSAEANIHDKLTPLLPAIRLCAQYGNLFGQHSYGGPQLVNPDTGVTEAVIEPFVFPEEWIAAELRRRGEPVPYFVNGEHGIDELISLHRHNAGWQTVSGLTGPEYFRQLVVTCQRKKAKGLVKAVFVFVDDTNPSGPWVQYNTHGGRSLNPPRNTQWETPVTLMIRDYHGAHTDEVITVPIQGPPVEQPPGVIPPANASKAVTKANGIAYNVRTAPVYYAANPNVNLILTLPANKAEPVDLTGNTAVDANSSNRYSEIWIAAILDQEGTIFHVKGWILTSGLQPRS